MEATARKHVLTLWSDFLISTRSLLAPGVSLTKEARRILVRKDVQLRRDVAPFLHNLWSTGLEAAMQNTCCVYERQHRKQQVHTQAV